MKIIITENQQRKLSHIFTIGSIVEQKRVKGGIVLKEIVAEISNDLNDLLPTIAGSEESTWKMTLSGDNTKNLELSFKGKTFSFKAIPHSNQSKVAVKNYRCGTTSKSYGSQPIICSNFTWKLQIPNLFDKFIAAYPRYAYLFEGKLENDEQSNNIKNQINNVVVNIGFERGTSSSGDKAGIIFELVKNKRKFRKTYKNNKKIYIGEPFPFYDLVSSGPATPLVIPINKDTNALLWHSETQKVLSQVRINPPPAPTPPIDDDEGIVAKNVSFKFQVTDPFEFDSPELSEKAENAIKNEMNKIYKLKDDGILERYITTQIKGKNIIVDAYSSIDAASDETGGGNVKECKPGKVMRKDYNLCLSQKRAETIVNHLNTEYADIFGGAKLIAKGRGELESTNSMKEKWGHPDQVAHKNAGRVATKEDRKFVINLPDFETTIKSSD